MPEKILVRSTNWIGDAVMSVAALRELRRLYPDAHLTLLARSWVAGVFEGQKLVDEVQVLKDGTSSLRRVLHASRELSGFDRAILFQNAFEAALLVFLAGIPRRIGYGTQGRSFLLTHPARPRIERLNRHQVYYYLDLLFQTGLSPSDYLNAPGFHPEIRLSPQPRALHRARELLHEVGVAPVSPLVGLNPGASYGPAKHWATDRYAALADRLIETRRAEVLVVGHAREEPIAREIASHMRRQPRILTGRTDLSTLMAVLSLCRLLITNDSGPMHLAAALDVPQVALFGSTDERATGPYSQSARVIHKHVECSPCLLRECPIDLRCFNRITVDEVYEAAEAALGGKGL